MEKSSPKCFRRQTKKGDVCKLNISNQQLQIGLVVYLLLLKIEETMKMPETTDATRHFSVSHNMQHFVTVQSNRASSYSSVILSQIRNPNLYTWKNSLLSQQSLRVFLKKP
ncbi:hypothetical protein OUZ56_020719 [Daphnia magna]|uniref:Uncharacterized protein n=1 Tax=Daphnia magna TaxID=35525 RepID=A0ABQ9ZF89_9CRUS|nr:hypothetical protein OUZ56_020719 [Daphnia magna]